VKIRAVTAWFPSAASPTTGTFVEKDVRVLARDHDVEVIHLVAPQLASSAERAAPGAVHRAVRDGLIVHRIIMSPQRPGHLLRARRLLAPLLAEADLVHTMAFPTLLPFALSRPTQPWVHTEHWSGLTTPATLPAAWRVALPALRPQLARPDVVTAVCEYLARPIRAVRERKGRPTVIVPCIVPPPERLAERRILTQGTAPDGSPRSDLALVGVGGLIDRKDPLIGVRVIAELRRRGLTATLTWAGEGPLRPQVLELAESLGVADRVTLLGSVDAAGVGQALADADLFFLPTKADNFCVSAAEALVHGRPVVVGATGGQGEYIADHVGELVAVQDVGAYADAVQRVYASTSDLTAQDIAATVGDAFTAEAVQAGYARAYEVALAGRGRTNDERP
jgi:L-malate glycosyltransferase